MPQDSEPTLYEPFAVPEIVVDGVFEDVRIEGGTLRCVTFSLQPVAGETESQATASGRLIMTKNGAAQLIAKLTAALTPPRLPNGAPRERRKLG